jgi:hypothetical protein
LDLPFSVGFPLVDFSSYVNASKLRWGKREPVRRLCTLS